MPELDPGVAAGRKDNIASELGQLVNLQQDAAEERRKAKRKKENVLPSDVFGGQIENVMRLCGVAREADLPDVWHGTDPG